MDAGILRALKTVKNNPYVQYVGLGLAGLVIQKDLRDQTTGKPLKKTKFELIRISAAVCGIELCYAAETAFVSPILLKLGVPASLMTMVWCLSPVLGFFLVPVMGSLSDRCRLKLGRRRPFIIILSIGIILGLALVPNGEVFGRLLGDTGSQMTGEDSIGTGFPKRKVENNSPYRTFRNVSASDSTDTLLDMNILSDETDTRLKKNYSDSSEIVLSFSVPAGRVRGIILTILGVALLDFNCDACQSPCRAYLLDVSLPEDHSTGLTMFTVMAGAGGAVGYLMGGIDWNATSFGEAFGGHIRIVFTIVLLAFFICIGLTLTSFKEVPLSELNLPVEDLQKKKKRKGRKKYKKFTNEDSFSTEEETVEERDERKGIDSGKQIETYGSLAETSTRETNIVLGSEQTNIERSYDVGNEVSSMCPNSRAIDTVGLSNPQNDVSSNNVDKLLNKSGTSIGGIPGHMNWIQFPDADNQSKPTHENNCSMNQTKRRKSLDFSLKPTPNGSIPQNKSSLTKSRSTGFSDEISPYAGWTMPDGNDIQSVVPETVQVSTDVTLKTYLKSIIRMPRCLWLLCLCNLFCWMSLVCYSLYFTDFVGQAVFGGNPQARVDSESHIRYDQGVRLGSFGMSLYSLACAAYSLVIEKLVNRFRAKKVYVIGQLVFTVGMSIMAATRHKVAVILLSPSAGIMYATLFTMPYLLVAHYHTRGLFSHGDVPGGEEKQVRGLGTDVAIVSSMVFLAQFLLSVFMGTLVSLLDSTVTVVIASSVLSFLGALTATQVTYLDL